MNITELRAEALKIAHQARDILTASEVTAEQTEQATRMLSESNTLEKRAQALVEIEKRERAYEAVDVRTPAETTTVEQRDSDKANEQRERVFADYLRGKVDERELRAQGIGTAAAGGNLVPSGFVSTLTTSLKAFGPLNEGGPVTYLPTDGGNPLPLPLLDDTASMGAQIAENTDTTDTNLTFGQKVMGAYKYTTNIVKLSTELLEDAATDPVEVVNSAMAERLGRILNKDFTTGTGTAMPGGIVTGATAGATAISATALAYKDILSLFHSVDTAYRDNGSFMFNDAVFLALNLLVDANGRPLFHGDVAGAAPNRLLGRPFYLNNDMDSTIASGKISMLFGDFSKFTVRKVRSFGLKRLDERFATSDQVAFVGFARYDSALLDTRAVKKFDSLMRATLLIDLSGETFRPAGSIIEGPDCARLIANGAATPIRETRKNEKAVRQHSKEKASI